MNTEKYEALADLIQEFTDSNGSFSPTPLKNLNFCRRNHTTNPMPCIYPLSLFLVVQGSQRLNFGEQVITLEQGQTVLTALDLPIVSNVLKANHHKPYLSLRIELDVMMLQELHAQTQWQCDEHKNAETLSVFAADEALLDAVYRYTALLKQPQLRPYLAPLIEREIGLRLLASGHNKMLRKLFTQGTVERNVSTIIAYFNEHYAEKIEMGHLAEKVFMSSSSLRAHFKKITGISPLQYQKQLRLQNARRLMINEQLDATSAALAVGYESPTQFNREYARMFGEPPLRDIQRLRENEMQFGKIV